MASHLTLRHVFRHYSTEKSSTSSAALSPKQRVIDSFAEFGSTSSVFSIFDDMDRNSVKPEPRTFTNAAYGFYNAKKFEEVGKVMNLMEERYKMYLMKVKLDIYNDLIHWLCNEGNIEEAKGLFAAMKKRSLDVDSDRYYNLVHLLCEYGEFEFALEIAKESIANGWFPSFTVRD